MSVIKIEQDIKLLEEKLEEINTTIADPIERNEYQKELQRNIRKLNRTKNSLELLQKEQQDLESLKSQVSTAKEQHENKPSVKRDRETINQPQINIENNGKHTSEQRENSSQVSKIKNFDDWEVEPDEAVDCDWNTSSDKSFDDWENNSCLPTSKNIEVEKDTMQTQTNLSSSQMSHQLYLSKREVWISTIFAILSFIFPYIYTRRWKPLCIVFISLMFFWNFILEEEILFTAPFISAIDNGIAISKSKSKLKQK